MRRDALQASVLDAQLLAEQGQLVLQADRGSDAVGGREQGDPGQGEGVEDGGAGPLRPTCGQSEPEVALARHHRTLPGAPILGHAAESDKSLQEEDMEARREISRIAGTLQAPITAAVPLRVVAPVGGSPPVRESPGGCLGATTRHRRSRRVDAVAGAILKDEDVSRGLNRHVRRRDDTGSKPHDHHVHLRARRQPADFDSLAALRMSCEPWPGGAIALGARQGDSRMSWNTKADLNKLEKAFEARDPGLPIAFANPLYEPLRSAPRFQVLRGKMKLPE